MGRIALAAALIGGCSGGTDLFLPREGEPAVIKVVGGNGQSGRVGEVLLESVVVEVNDSRGRPVEGAEVVFEFSSAPGAEIVPEATTTDANGEADAQVKLGTRVGSQVGEARVVVAEGALAPAVSFNATAFPVNANGIAAVSGQDQSGPAGSLLGAPLVVEVTDAFGNPIPGVPIEWSAEGGGSISAASVITDDQGRASVQRTLGPSAGRQSTLARATGLAGSPVTFLHTATAGNASRVAIVSGNNQTAAVGARLPAELVVQLLDGEGNGVAGTAVTWVVGFGGGSVTPENDVTDADGRSSVQWTLGGSPGENRVDAVVSGVGIANFRATATAGAPAALSIRTQPSSSARNGVPLDRQPVIQVRDAQGNDVATAGIEVTAQLGSGGGALSGTRQRRTDGNGRASFTDLAISGAPGQRTLVFTASGYAGVTSNGIDLRPVGTTTTITSDAPDPSAPGTAFTIDFRVTSPGPTPTGSVTVTPTDGGPSCTGILREGIGSCQLTLNRVGSRTLRATYSGAPGLDGSSDTEDHRVEAAPTPNQPPVAEFTQDCDELNCRFDSDPSNDPDGRVVGWSWNFGDGQSSDERRPRHEYAAGGTYTVTLTVTDDDGARDDVSHQVTVNAPPPPNQDPNAEFAWSCVHLACDFADQSSDSDGNVVSWDWDFGDGGNSDARNPTHSYSAAGTYSVRLTVRDDDGASNSVTHPVTVTAPPPPNQQPDAEFSWQCSDLTCQFTDESSDGDGTITGWSWVIEDIGTRAEQSPSVTFPQAGTYTVTLTVTDDDGATDQTSAEVRAPKADFDIDCVDATLTCTFTDRSAGTPLSWTWQFGDGITSPEQNPTHTYTSAEVYSVTLTVTYSDGQSQRTRVVNFTD